MEEVGGDLFRTQDWNVHVLTGMLISTHWAETASGCAQGKEYKCVHTYIYMYIHTYI